jgi:hypothetical protein
MNENYYYGQGKIYLSEIGPNGKPVNWLWVGDVSAFSLQIAINNQKTRKESFKGSLVVTRTFVADRTGHVNMVWHDFSRKNLAILLAGNDITIPSTWDEIEEELPRGLTKGVRISLDYQRVWGVSIPGLEKDVDYVVDSMWGVIDFIRTPASTPDKVFYRHGENTPITIMTKNRGPLALRYEGVNLAEGNAPILAYLYKIQLSPAETVDLINNGDGVSAFNTTALMIADTRRGIDSTLGMFGQISMLQPLGLRHDGSIIRNGTYNYSGKRIQ